LPLGSTAITALGGELRRGAIFFIEPIKEHLRIIFLQGKKNAIFPIISLPIEFKYTVP